jgi:hypothetical protein
MLVMGLTQKLSNVTIKQNTVLFYITCLITTEKTIRKCGNMVK